MERKTLGIVIIIIAVLAMASGAKKEGTKTEGTCIGEDFSCDVYNRYQCKSPCKWNWRNRECRGTVDCSELDYNSCRRHNSCEWKVKTCEIANGDYWLCKTKECIDATKVTVRDKRIVDCEEEEEWIYQETANELACQSSCINNGCWIETNDKSGFGDICDIQWWGKMHDGDWNSYIQLPIDTHIYMNYTKPNNVIGAVWKVKDVGGTVELTIPDTCWDYDGMIETESEKLQFKVYSAGMIGDLWQCYNGIGWETLRAGATHEFEEGIYWQLN